MPMDGNCLFHALAHPDGDHRRVRERVVSHIAKHWKTYGAFALDDRTYVERMARDGTWGDELVLRAHSRATRSDVIVRDARRPQRVLRDYRVSQPKRTHQLLFDGSHYDCIIGLPSCTA